MSRAVELDSFDSRTELTSDENGTVEMQRSIRARFNVDAQIGFVYVQLAIIAEGAECGTSTIDKHCGHGRGIHTGESRV